MKPYLTTDAATLYHARAEEVYPHIAPGSVSMIWSDGPYAMRKAAWDMMGVDGLADWYAPHIEAWGKVCAPSATVYLWNTAEGWARIDPVMRAAGWVFRTLIVWDKMTPPSMLGWKAITEWPDQTEVAGTYSRGTPHFQLPAPIGNVWEFSTKALSLEQIKGVAAPAKAASDGDTCASLHPCQKPLAFASRAILASTRIGDTILDPFAGTNRIAVACRRLPPEERRHAVGIEMERRWLDAVRPSLVADHGAEVRKGQPSLFGPRRSVV